MGSLSWARMLLVLLCALQEATSLIVQQWPVFLRVTQGSQATLGCRVTQAGAWERLRVQWAKDSAVMCQLLLTNGTHSPSGCGPRGQLLWPAPGDMRLQLDQLTLNDSGAYVCRATVEIPELEQAEGNQTQLLVSTDGSQQNQNGTPRVSGLLWVLLVAGGVATAAVAVLVAGVWGRCYCQRKDSENPFYSNVLYRPREVPKRSNAWPGQGKALDTPREDQKAQRVYCTSFPQPPTRLPQPATKPRLSPGPAHAISTVRVSPGPGTSK
ncbi:PREDICTED: transmembrane and immunoglobulin domain-containing protein 2 isoform X3 [Chinchilla lanigera]|uniref:Transmembrane and immunoglobulin domain containing 2 n=1 Tax=Chinchilla lanigera TaxID=34839 RepID=A0A8C2W445_CHILA|nr:PREDICTED: transmembrane and immunoglobulin domain-containing protein 2 isoform X3 [Chinchilla lanigera]